MFPLLKNIVNEVSFSDFIRIFAMSVNRCLIFTINTKSEHLLTEQMNRQFFVIKIFTQQY